MKLNEKICYCRRKAGLSQEALAERIGVSRQAISKWETGEASPEITKLPLLASTFGVTADWLLSEEDPAGDAPPEPTPEAPSHSYAPTGAVHINAVPDWVDKLPGFLGRLIRQYGWLVGVRIAIAGALFTTMGFVARAMFSSMGNMADSMMGSFSGGGVTFYDNAGRVVSPGSLGLSAGDLNAMGLGGNVSISIGSAMSQPADILTGSIIFLGLVMLVGGALLAWYLKKWGRENA